MTHRILLVLLSCTALGWAVPAMAEDDWAVPEATDQSYYGYGGEAAVGGSWTGTGETTTDVGAVAGDQSYYDYGGAAATTSSGFDGVTNWTDESGATPTGNTITNWTEGDVDPLAAGGGGSFLYPAIGGIGAMSGFSMQNLSKLFNPTKPGGCNMSVPMMNNLSGTLAAFGKFLGAQDKCNQQQVTKTMMAEQKSFGQYLARQQNQQLIFSKNSLSSNK